MHHGGGRRACAVTGAAWAVRCAAVKHAALCSGHAHRLLLTYGPHQAGRRGGSIPTHCSSLSSPPWPPPLPPPTRVPPRVQCTRCGITAKIHPTRRRCIYQRSPHSTHAGATLGRSCVIARPRPQPRDGGAQNARAALQPLRMSRRIAATPARLHARPQRVLLPPMQLPPCHAQPPRSTPASPASHARREKSALPCPHPERIGSAV